ncbi:MAG: acylphosphatase [Actinomycetota bacterium]|nr:acylphosphatase [Actinomycetota bacterium]
MGHDRIRRRVVIHGRVQGVFFRDSIRQRARDIGIAGWVRNRPDGTVEAVLEGPPDAVQEILRFGERGPPRAQVARTEVTEEPPEGVTGFSVR